MESPAGLFEGDLTTPLSDQDKEKATGWLNKNKGGWEKAFDAFLLTRTFVLGGSLLSRADLVVYVVVHDVVSKMKPKAFGNFPNLVRWFDFVQHQEPAASFGLASVAIARTAPAFLTAPPAPSAAPSAAPSKAPAAASSSSSSSSPAPAAPAKEEKKQEKPAAEAPKEGKGQQQGEGQQQGKGKGGGAGGKGKGKGKGPAPKQPAAPLGSNFSRLSIVVGQIASAKNHPDADSLYFEQIDLGEEKPRDVVSGLVKHISLDEFIGKRVLVLTNLKPAKMRGILSSGMVLCASTEDSLEVLSPPEGAKVGERLVVAGEDGPADAVLPPKKKIWDQVRDSGDFTVAESGEIMYQGKPLTSTAGPCVSAKKLVGAKIA